MIDGETLDMATLGLAAGVGVAGAVVEPGHDGTIRTGKRLSDGDGDPEAGYCCWQCCCDHYSGGDRKHREKHRVSFADFLKFLFTPTFWMDARSRDFERVWAKWY